MQIIDPKRSHKRLWLITFIKYIYKLSLFYAHMKINFLMTGIVILLPGRKLQLITPSY